jgi:hypothetical protein
MTWAHLTVAGLSCDVVGAIVVAWGVFGVTVDKIFKQALNIRADAGHVNKRAHWLGEQRAYARFGVLLLVAGAVLQLTAVIAAELHGGSEVALGIVAALVPVVVALIGVRTLVPRWMREVDDAGATAGRGKPV